MSQSSQLSHADKDERARVNCHPVDHADTLPSSCVALSLQVRGLNAKHARLPHVVCTRVLRMLCPRNEDGSLLISRRRLVFCRGRMLVLTVVASIEESSVIMM